jgi:Tol biopolymer transport system component
VRWSPDGAWLTVVCDNEVVVMDLNGQRPHLLGPPADLEPDVGLPRDTLALVAGWTPDAETVVVVTAPSGSSQLGALQIVGFDRGGARRSLIQTSTSTEWVVGTSTISPDGRWALVQGDGNVPSQTWYPTYAVETETGAATKLPWTVIHDATEPSSVSWLAEPGRFLYEEGQMLYEVDLAAMTRTEVGAIPAADYAWYDTEPLALPRP